MLICIWEEFVGPESTLITSVIGSPEYRGILDGGKVCITIRLD